MLSAGRTQSSKTSSRRVRGAPAVLVERAADPEAPRSLLDEEHRDALGRFGVIGLRRNDVEIGMNAVGDEDLGPIQTPVSPDARRRRADALYVRTGIRLRHGDGRDDFARDDARHPLRFLGLAPGIEQVNGCHVRVHQRGDGDAGIGRASQLLGKDDGRKRIHVGAAVLRRVADTEKSQGSHPAQDFARYEARLLPCIGARPDLFGNEAAHLIPQHFVLGREPQRR